MVLFILVIFELKTKAYKKMNKKLFFNFSSKIK